MSGPSLLVPVWRRVGAVRVSMWDSSGSEGRQTLVLGKRNKTTSTRPGTELRDRLPRTRTDTGDVEVQAKL